MARSSRPARGRRPGQKKGEPDDAFIAKVLEFSNWAKDRTHVLVGMAVVLVLLVAGTIYYLNTRAAERAEAERQLEAIHGVVGVGETEQASEELRTFLARFDGTPAASEARLLLAQIQLEEDDPAAAVETLRPLTNRLREPVAQQGAFLLGIAYEELEQWDDAERVYLDLAEEAELGFQRREALEGAARVRAELGRHSEAVELYRRILDTLEPDDPRWSRFQMKLAEAEARADGGRSG